MGRLTAKRWSLLKFSWPVAAADVLTQSRKSEAVRPSSWALKPWISVDGDADHEPASANTGCNPFMSLPCSPRFNDPSQMSSRGPIWSAAGSAMLAIPAFGLCAVLSGPTVELLLGQRWLSIAPVVSFLCAAGLLTTLDYLNGSALVARGAPKGRLTFPSARSYRNRRVPCRDAWRRSRGLRSEGCDR